LQSHWEQKILTDTAAEVKPELLTAERSFEMLMAAGRMCVNLGCLTICAAKLQCVLACLKASLLGREDSPAEFWAIAWDSSSCCQSGPAADTGATLGAGETSSAGSDFASCVMRWFFYDIKLAAPDSTLLATFGFKA